MTLTEKHALYLTSIGADESVQEKLELAAGFADLLTDEEIEDLFITNQQGNEGVILLNAWFFTRHYALEAQDFQLKQMVDIVLFERNIQRIAVTAENFTPGQKSTKDSRLQIDGGAPIGFGFRLTAVGENCDELVRILLTRFAANLLQPRVQ